MKTQFLLLLITLTTFSVYSQKQFEGSWTTPTSDYVTIISVGEYGVSNVVNYDFKEDIEIVEKIIKRGKNRFKTQIFNNENGYMVTISYKLKDPNTIICKFKGDLKDRLVYSRVFDDKFNKNTLNE